MYVSSKRLMNFTQSSTGRQVIEMEIPEDMKTAPLKVIQTLLCCGTCVWAYFLFPLPVQQTWDPRTLAEGLSTS